MKIIFKKMLFSTLCLLAMAMLCTIASCDKDCNGTLGGSGITPAGYVDLGLPSGTKWKAVNETKPNDTCDFYTCDEAMEKFGYALPTGEQCEELIDCCQWMWNDTKKGYEVVGPNSKSIFLPAAGGRSCNGDVGGMGFIGRYWSFDPPRPNELEGRTLCADLHGSVTIEYFFRCVGYPVRLVYD